MQDLYNCFLYNNASSSSCIDYEDVFTHCFAAFSSSIRTLAISTVCPCWTSLILLANVSVVSLIKRSCVLFEYEYVLWVWSRNNIPHPVQLCACEQVSCPFHSIPFWIFPSLIYLIPNSLNVNYFIFPLQFSFPFLPSNLPLSLSSFLPSFLPSSPFSYPLFPCKAPRMKLVTYRW